MNVHIWIRKKDFLKFVIMRKYATESQEAEDALMNAAIAHYVPYYSQPDATINVSIPGDIRSYERLNNVDGIGLSLPVEEYIQLELVTTLAKR